MGWYTDIIVTHSECTYEEETNNAILDAARICSGCSSLAVVETVVQTNVIAGQAKSLDIDRFMHELAYFCWEYPENVCLLISDEHEDSYVMYRLADKKVDPPDIRIHAHQDWCHDLVKGSIGDVSADLPRDHWRET